MLMDIFDLSEIAKALPELSKVVTVLPNLSEVAKAIDWFFLFNLAACVLAMGALGANFRLARHLLQLQTRVRTMLRVVEQDLRLSGLTLKATDARVEALERNAKSLKRAQYQLETRSGSANYGQAINLVRRGWHMEDLISTCGLTRGEAELVYVLHGPGGALKGHGGEIKINN